jgi:uncharacterized protein (DUF1800 family)
MVEERIEAGCASVADDMACIDTPTTETTTGNEAAADSSRPLKALAAFSISAALAACGGGGGGGGGGGFPFLPGAGGSPGAGADAGPYHYPQAQNDQEAARFLLQAQFSASDAEIADVRSKGYLPWLSEQFGAPRAQSAWEWLDSKPFNTADIDAAIWRQLMASVDPARKRMALALSEIFVVSANEIGSSWPSAMMCQYWDTLVAGVTGNFRKLLEDVTLNPAMGFYLNTRDNRKEDGRGRQPDENYAREVMQLMTIGLSQLNADGTVKTGADGQPIDTYTQDDVSQLARVFTGYDLDIRPGERNGFTPPGGGSFDTKDWTTRPMAFTAANHSMLEARFLGATVPGGTPGPAALKIALDTLFNHANVGPFIGKQLIQRLVTSNPSPAYVKRVADTFANNGAGVRGDMKSVFAAVLLDDEARAPAGLTDPNFGRLREPMLRVVQWGRTCGIVSATDAWTIGITSDASFGIGQSPLRSPSVFNFFRPGYVPPSTAIASNKLVAPEFQLVNESSVGSYLNFMQKVLPNGFNNDKEVVASYAAEKALVLDPAALVRRLNLLLTANQLSATTVTLITTALGTPNLTAASTDNAKLNRICAAVLLVMGSPEYLVQK